VGAAPSPVDRDGSIRPNLKDSLAHQLLGRKSTSRQEQPSSGSQSFSCAALTPAVSVVPDADASVTIEGLRPLWDSCSQPLSPLPFF
jgi:hypothetical protein